jgi:hypothetical protein
MPMDPAFFMKLKRDSDMPVSLRIGIWFLPNDSDFIVGLLLYREVLGYRNCFPKRRVKR